MKPKFRRAAALSSFLSIVVCSTAAQAATLYWDALGTTVDGISQGGTTTTWSTSAGNWDTGAAEVFWTSGNTAVLGGTASSVTIGAGGVTVGGLTFQTTAYTLAAGTNGFNFSSGTNNVTLAVPGTSIPAATISGTVGGSGANLVLSNLDFGFAGTLTFTGASATGWTGTTTVNQGATLVYDGSFANAALASTTAITLNSGTISSGGGILSANNTFNYINDTAPITVNGGGSLTYRPINAGPTFTENIGAVTVNSGHMSFATGSISSGTATLIMPSITRTDATSSLSFALGNNGLTTNTNRIKVTGAGTTSGWVSAASSNPIIGPWAMDGIGTNADYAIYSSDFALPAATASSAESTWSDAAKQYNTVANIGAVTLTGNRISLAQRYSTNSTGNSVTVTANNPTISVPGRNFAAGDAVYFGGTMPTGLTANTIYFVVNPGTNTIQVSATSGGVAITPTTAGTSVVVSNGAVVTANSATISLPNHTFSNGDPVLFSGTTIPTGLTAATTYYVVNSAANTIQVSATPGGAAITPTTAGNGVTITGGGYNLGNNTAGTTGILNAAALPIMITAAGGTGSLTLPSATPANIFVSTTGAAVTISSPIINNTASGVLTLVKIGANTLTLSNASNTYTGRTVLNAGTLAIGNVGNIGGAGASLTFGGTGTLTPSAALNFSTGTLTVNQGALATIGVAANVTFATTTGSGMLVSSATANTTTLNLGNASGFTGTLEAFYGGGTSGTVQFSSLGDAAGSLLAFGGNASDSNQRSNFIFNGSSPLTFASTGRQLAITPTSGSNGGARYHVLQNNSTLAANSWVINSDVINVGARSNIELVLDGSNVGSNALNGAIGNNTINGGALWVGKTGVGKWILGGANTFTGRLIASQGTLSVGTLNDATVPGPLGKGPVQLGGSEVAIGTSQGNVLVGSNSGILEYTGGAVTTSRVFLLGDTTVGNTGGGTIANNGSGAIIFSASTLNTAQTGITATRVLTFGGTYAATTNEIQGSIVDNATVTTGRVGVIFNGGTWKLSGSATSVSGLVTAGSALGIRVQSGTLEISAGGTTVGNALGLGSFSADAGTFNQTGGTISLAGDLIVGWNSNPTFTLSAGALTTANIIHKDAGTGSVTISGSAIVTAPNVLNSTAGTGTDSLTVNLNTGGTLVATRMYVNATAATLNGSHALNISLNGGTLKSLASGNLIDVPTGTNSANASVIATVKLGGAIFDTNTFNSSVLRALVHDAGLGATADGGLTKQGVGTLTLAVANTYTGITTVTQGTLALGASNIVPDASNVSIGAATLNAATFTDTAGTLDTTGAAIINIGSGGALAFANSSAVDWTGGSLNITGTYTPTSIRFGTTSTALTSGQLAVISVNGSGAGSYTLDANGYLIIGGPGPVDHFAISVIGSPQTVGTPITGITLTAQDASNATATSFTGTVTFGGTGGFTGTSATFTAGVLNGVSVTPTVAGSNLTFTVNDGASHTGTTTIATIQSQYTAWSGGAAFDADTNGDGVKNGLAFLLGAANKDVNALALVPVPTQDAGKLVMTFDCLSSANRGDAVLNLQYSNDLGIADLWTNHEAAVPGTAPTSTIVNTVNFTTTTNGALIHVVAEIPASAASPGSALFGRLNATTP